MRKIFSLIAACGLIGSVGCANIASSMGANTAQTGEAWYVKTTALGGLILSSKVFYCPAPTGGAAKCTEAKMVEGAK
jgi:hypothetical protein